MVVLTGVGFFQIGFCQEFLAARTDLCGRRQFASPPVLQQDGFHVSRVEGLPDIGTGDCCDNVPSAVQMHEIEQPSQVDGGLHRLTPQFQMKLPCVFAKRIEGLFDVMRPHTMSQLQGFQPMIGQTDQLVAVVAAGMTGRNFAVGNHAHLRVAGPNHYGCVLQLWRNRVTIPVEVDSRMGTDDRRHHFVSIERKSWQRTEDTGLLSESIDRSLPCRLMQPNVGDFITPGDSESPIVVPAHQFVLPACQRISLDITDARLDGPFRFRISPLAGNRFQTEVATECQKFRMQARLTSGTVQHGRFEIIKDDPTRTAAKERQGIHDRAVEFRLPLRQGEFDIAQSAVTQHRHKHGHLSLRAADADLPTVAPVDLHGLPRFVLDFLINTAASWSDLTKIDPNECQLSLVAVGPATNLFHDTRCRKLWIARQQCIDLWLPGVEQTASRSTSSFVRRMIHAERLRDSPLATAQTPGHGAL